MAINRRKLNRLACDLKTCYFDAVTISQSRGLVGHQERDFNALNKAVLDALNCATTLTAKYPVKQKDGNGNEN